MFESIETLPQTTANGQKLELKGTQLKGTVLWCALMLGGGRRGAGGQMGVHGAEKPGKLLGVSEETRDLSVVGEHSTEVDETDPFMHLKLDFPFERRAEGQRGRGVEGQTVRETFPCLGGRNKRPQDTNHIQRRFSNQSNRHTNAISEKN